jgi:5'-nucleotidase
MPSTVRRAFVVAFALCAGPAPQAGQRAETARTVSIQLVAINDFHGNLDPPAGSEGRINGTPAGGAEYLATHIAEAVKANPNSLVVAAGDVVGASPLVSSLFHEEPAIEAMNAMGLAVSAVGNHEFDKGFRELLRMKRGGCHPFDGCQDGDGFAGARFQYLSANVVVRTTGMPLFPATAVRRVGGVLVGFIGETLQGTPAIVTAAGTRGLRFLDEAATANAYAARLKRQGVHAIVLLLHEGGRQRPSEGGADVNGCVNFGGAIVPIVEQLSDDIPIVITGHSHQFYNCRIGSHLVTSAGSYGRLITRVTMEIDRASDRVRSASATNEIVTRDVAKDSAQTRLLVKYGKLAEAKANVIVGSVTADLLHTANTAGESALGDVVADAQLAATRAPGKGGAVVAFMNTGGLRADIVARPPVGSTAAGEVTYRDLYSVQPFGNVLTVVTLTGETNMLQVSSGFTYRYRRTAPSGQHVEADSIVLDGRRIAPTDRIRVQASDFLIGGGNGYTVLREGMDKVVGVPDIDALVEYFKTRSPVAPPPMNRIVRID